jgi:hypothetical protein
MISTLKIVSIFFSLLNWVLDSACAFSFTFHWPINILINCPLQSSAHFLFVLALSAHLDYSTNNLNNTI